MTPIPGFPGYTITELGGIYSLPRQGTKGGRLCLQHRPDGYLSVVLRRNGNSITRLVHQLVLESFVGSRPSGYDACHTNGIRLDNSLKNLRWDTRKANHADALRHRTHPGLLHRPGPKGEANARARLNGADIPVIRYLYDVAGFSTGDIAWQFDISYKTIWKIVTRRNWKHICQDRYQTN